MANENGWGDGASNNNIGWGQGAINNAISWGAIHSLSAAGLTDIVGQTFQPESVAYFTAIEDAGGTLTDNVKAEWDAVIVALKDANLYSRFHFITPKLGGKAASAVLDATGNLTPINVNFTDADADPLIGLKGDGSTKKIDYGIAANAMLLNFNWAIGVQYITQPVNAKYTLGAYNSASEVVNLRFGTNYSYIYGQSLSIYDTQTQVPSYPQIHIGSRVSQTSLKLYINGSGLTTTTTSDTGTIPATNFAEYGLGLVLPEDSKHGIAFATDGLNDSEASTINGIFTTFYNNITAYAALMDSYSGAAAAYSLRKLYSSYEGSAINVRRSSDNATQDIGFDGYVLDTDSLLSFVGAGDGYVTKWYDQSGNGSEVIQTTASAQRKIVSSGSLITHNGKVGVQDTATSTQYNSTGRLFSLDTPNLFSFSVQNFTGGITTPYLIGSNPMDKGFLMLSPSSGEAINTYTIRSTSRVALSSSGVISGYKLLTTNADRSNINAYVNSSLVATNTDTDTDFATFTNNTLWGTQESTARRWPAIVQEFILYEVDQSSNRTAIESLINSYYSIY